MLPPPLACPVRGCGLPLTLHARAYRCAAGHNHDVARSGYVNLLQPQDRRSAEPGDAREAVQARLALEAAGVGTALTAAVSRILSARLPATAPRVTMVDLGCGTGRALAELAGKRDVTAIGIDLSMTAARAAARQWPGLTWVVANADRTLPLLDASVDVLLSLNARRNPAEASRVLTAGGALVIAVPAPGDLAELRERVQGVATPRDRVEGLAAEHEPWFRLGEHHRVTDARRLDRELLLALLRATYRGARGAQAGRTEALSAMTVTLASDLCVFVPREGPRGKGGSAAPRQRGRGRRE